jgi:hypothetical protein
LPDILTFDIIFSRLIPKQQKLDHRLVSLDLTPEKVYFRIWTMSKKVSLNKKQDGLASMQDLYFIYLGIENKIRFILLEPTIDKCTLKSKNRM